MKNLLNKVSVQNASLKVTDVIFGSIHFGFQSAADITMFAESKVKRIINPLSTDKLIRTHRRISTRVKQEEIKLSFIKAKTSLMLMELRLLEKAEELKVKYKSAVKSDVTGPIVSPIVEAVL